MSEITNLNTAKAVITAAKENDVWESPIPTDEKQLLADATFVYEQADAAWNNNIRGKAVTAVKFAAEVTGASEGEDFTTPDIDDDEYNPSDYKVTEVVDHIEILEDQGDLDEIESIQRVDGRKGVQRATEAALARLAKVKEHDDGFDNAHQWGGEGPGVDIDATEAEAKVAYPTRPDNIDTGGWTPKKSKLDETFEANEFAKAQASKMNLPVPQAVDDIPAATLSRGVANLTIQDLAERLTDASLCLAAATWQTAIAEIDEEHAKRVGSHYFNKEYAKAAPNAKNKEAAVAKAEEDQAVRQWRDKQAEAESRYVTFRALKEIYKGTYDTVSRVFAMKQEERERSQM